LGDILKSLGGGWSFLLSWVLPGALFWSVFGLFIFPSLDGLPIFREVAGTSFANQSLVLAGAAIFTGLLLNATSNVLYRILEGYYLSRVSHGRMWKHLKQRQIKKRDRLRDRLNRLRETPEAVPQEEASKAVPQDKIQKDSKAVPRDQVREGLLRERLRRYPADPEQFGPTSFANALRAIETYGWNRYKLDSQALWSELTAVAPESLRTEEEAARTPINFSVSLLYLSLVTAGICGIAFGTTDQSLSLVFVGFVALALAPAWYQLAVLNTRYLNSVVQAIVNLGRQELAKKYGLILPRKLEDERDMWERLWWFVYEPYDPAYIDDLNSYRTESDVDNGSAQGRNPKPLRARGELGK
jgi:hypothetical protein